MTVTVEPVDAPLGALVKGVDLSAPLDDTAFAAIRRALVDHLVLVISGLPGDFQALLAFGRRFGTLVPHV